MPSFTRTLRVKWQHQQGERPWDGDKLRALFSQFGKLEEVVVKEKKKRSSALLVYEDMSSVVKAANSPKVADAGLTVELLSGESVDSEVSSFQDV